MEATLAPLIAIAAWLVGLSVLVQVLQELWKFTSSSKSRAYEKALADFIGPFVVERLRQDPVLAVRGPLQFRRIGSAGNLLPLNAEDLISAIGTGGSEWQRLLGRTIEREVALQEGGPDRLSPGFRQFLENLQRGVEDERLLSEHRSPDDSRSPIDRWSPSDEASSQRPLPPAGRSDAGRIYGFLAEWGLLVEGEGIAAPRLGATTAPIDAAILRKAFQQELVPQIETVKKHYDQFLSNFTYRYRRRNLRQTFTIALFVAVALNLPFGRIHARATAVSPEEAVAMAASAEALVEQLELSGADSAELREIGARSIRLAEQATAAACSSSGAVGDVQATQADALPCEPYSIDLFLHPGTAWDRFRATGISVSYLLGCLLTAVLITFGAPFWNDVSSALLRVARPSSRQQNRAAPDLPVRSGTDA